MLYETRTYKFELHELNSETLRKRRFEEIVEELKDFEIISCEVLKTIGDWQSSYLKIVIAKSDYGSCQLLDGYNNILREGHIDENGKMHWIDASDAGAPELRVSNTDIDNVGRDGDQAERDSTGEDKD